MYVCGILAVFTYGSGLYWAPPKKPCLSGCVVTDEHIDVVSPCSLLSPPALLTLFCSDILNNNPQFFYLQLTIITYTATTTDDREVGVQINYKTCMQVPRKLTPVYNHTTSQNNWHRETAAVHILRRPQHSRGLAIMVTKRAQNKYKRILSLSKLNVWVGEWSEYKNVRHF